MTVVSDFPEPLQRSVMLQLAVAFGVILLYPFARALHDVYLSPLSRLPGPKLWAVSRLPFLYNFVTGKLTRRERDLHAEYGEIVRLGPNIVSFANKEAWEEIYAHHRGHKRAMRDPAFHKSPKGQPDTIVATSDLKFHGRVRGLLSISFTDEALQGQRPILQHHANNLVARLRQLIASSESSPSGALVNMPDWTNFFTADVISDLAFGKSFGCLELGEYHTWVQTLYNWAKNNENFKKLSKAEIISQFTFIIVAGSDTTSTTMVGILNHLCKKDQVLARQCAEVRRRFGKEEDIVIDALLDLPYLEAVINEGLRLCNPVPGGLRRLVPAGGDTYCGVFLPENTRISIRPFVVSSSPKYFADPEEFVPERWLPRGERPSKYNNDQLSASKPFSIGFHACLGQQLALAELRLQLARLMWAFDFEEEPTRRVDYDDFPVIMLVEKKPMMLRVKLRSDAARKED